MLIIVFAQTTQLYIAIGLLILIGSAGGFYVVPLNALLQERGHETVGAGNAVAVQNFFAPRLDAHPDRREGDR